MLHARRRARRALHHLEAILMRGSYVVDFRLVVAGAGNDPTAAGTARPPAWEAGARASPHLSPAMDQDELPVRPRMVPSSIRLTPWSPRRVASCSSTIDVVSAFCSLSRLRDTYKHIASPPAHALAVQDRRAISHIIVFSLVCLFSIKRPCKSSRLPQSPETTIHDSNFNASTQLWTQKGRAAVVWRLTWRHHGPPPRNRSRVQLCHLGGMYARAPRLSQTR